MKYNLHQPLEVYSSLSFSKFAEFWNHLIFCTFPKRPLVPVCNLIPTLSPSNLFSVSTDLPFSFLIHIESCVCLLCLVSFTLHNVCAFHLPGSMYFIFITESYCATLVCHLWFTHSFAVGTVKELFISLLWIIPLWTFPCKSMCRHAFQTFRVYTQEWMTGPYVHSMFNLLKSWQTVFHSSCTIWHDPPQCMHVPIAQHPCQHLFFSFLFTAFLVGIKWYLIVVLLCISLMANDAEHLFMCLVVIHRSFFWRNVYSSPLPVSIFVHLFLKDVFNYFIIWPWRVFDTARGLSLVPVSRGYCSSCAGFSRRRWRLSLWSTGAVGACAPAVAVCRLRSCGSWAQ